jgi:hypothetical protein
MLDNHTRLSRLIVARARRPCAGVPTISMPRCKHAGRHAVSMLRAVGGWGGVLQPRDEDEYEEMAVRLLQRPAFWKRAHQDIVRSRGLGAGAGLGSQHTSPLWTPARWVSDLEKALVMAWEWHVLALEGDPFLARGGNDDWDSGTARG